MKQAKLEKHLIEVEERQFWRFGSGIIREIPNIEKRKQIIEEVHKKLLHREIEPVYYKLKERHYWPGIKREIEEIIKKCQICNIYNRKKKTGNRFVTTTRKL